MVFAPSDAPIKNSFLRIFCFKYFINKNFLKIFFVWFLYFYPFPKWMSHMARSHEHIQFWEFIFVMKKYIWNGFLIIYLMSNMFTWLVKFISCSIAIWYSTHHFTTSFTPTKNFSFKHWHNYFFKKYFHYFVIPFFSQFQLFSQ